MEAVLGVGGIFFKARDPAALAQWYRDNLGVPIEEGQSYGVFSSQNSDEKTVWSTFPLDTDYFGPGTSPFMINFRVLDLDAMLAQLREAGIQVEAPVDQAGYGRFGWATDPEGNRFEMWEPPR